MVVRGSGFVTRGVALIVLFVCVVLRLGIDFNQRGVRSRGLLFYRLLEQAAQTGHTTTDELHGTWGFG